MQSNVDENPEGDLWNQMAPMLDGAIASLAQKDRDAIVLRYFEGRNCADVGRALGSTESAAQRRISRALGRLRKLFTKRGVVITGSMLASLMAANCAQAAPAGMATSVAAAGLLKGASASAATLGVIKATLNVMAWAKLKFAAAVGVGVAVATGTAVVAISYAAKASHPPSDGKTLSANSPFVRQLSNPPWIKQMRYEQGRYVYMGGQPSHTEPLRPSLQVSTNIAAVQPSGMYLESIYPAPNGRGVSGVDDQIYWSGAEVQKSLYVTPVAPDATYGQPVVEGIRPLIEEVRNLGLPALRPGTFEMQDGSRFKAVTLKGEAFEGEILKVSYDRPLALSYRLADPLSPPGTIAYTITYQYASDTAPLPESFDHMEIGEEHRQGTNGTERIAYWDRSSYSLVFRIITADYGLDQSVTHGYSPARFFPDAAQFRVHTNWISNGTVYIDGVARPALTPRRGARGGIAVQPNK